MPFAKLWGSFREANPRGNPLKNLAVLSILVLNSLGVFGQKPRGKLCPRPDFLEGKICRALVDTPRFPQTPFRAYNENPRPTPSFEMAFDHFGDHFGEPIVEDRPLEPHVI